ncbi:MAG: thioredoxin family protein [Thermoanaerobaculia bacterium]|nr:thioredoxin family protein [Thermoanaerobaculia bacterium]
MSLPLPPARGFRFFLLATLLGSSSLFIACQPAAEEVAVETPADSSSQEIAWFEGSVEEAFATAKEENKPLFLYWGAVWCPPCHYLKDKIFKTPEFVAQSRKFIAVYLDGDTDRAQAWGEKLKISGYPTVLILNPEGDEVMRMSSGIPVEEYNGVLDAALTHMRPIKDVLADVLAVGVAKADPTALDLLANYEWGQDRTVELSAEERFATFHQLYEGTPQSLRVVKSHFLANMLSDAAGLAADEERSEPVLTGEQVTAYRAAVQTLLSDRELRNANPFFVALSASKTIDLLEPKAGEGREALIAAWLAAGNALENDDSLSAMDRVYAVYVPMDIAEMRAGKPAEGEEAAPMPPEVLDAVRHRIAWANDTVTDEGELQGVMNVMLGVLESAGLEDEAKTLAEARLQDTEAPHYYMSWLSDLEESAGDKEAALAWSRRAYDESEGPYTRFQWGTSYIQDAIRLVPDDIELIEKASSEILEELLQNDDAFANRNQSRVSRLDSAYDEWAADSEERKAAVLKIRTEVGSACERFADGEGDDTPRARCESFADPAPEVDAPV